MNCVQDVPCRVCAPMCECVGMYIYVDHVNIKMIHKGSGEGIAVHCLVNNQSKSIETIHYSLSQ